MEENKNYELDYIFYSTFYPDLNKLEINTYDKALHHFINYGLIEGRVRCYDELIDKINNNLSLIEKQKNLLNNFKYIKKYEETFNILIRTSMRPDYFDICIKSVLNQNYTNYNIFVCYDNVECLTYLKNYNYNNLKKNFIQVESKEKYKFNLYNNFLMSMVNDGFIIFLDDDDVFTHNNVLKIINENINNIDDILLWKFMRPDKLVYPKDVYNIKLGDIDTTSVCFHNKYKELSEWGDKQCGDFYFYTKLFKTLKINHVLRIKKINYILTKTIYLDKLCNSA